ncbi:MULTISPECIES: type I-E CRISPR-associated protein Cas6/Cse3/CasE [Roseomonadaceae]|uniref:Type I-E CRISPR-associated protein Cas6/Cse3/CasE n=1 Tax=Falsiroseomonas oleicola TaxID=2801474 RepID=A0ABS6HD76_9PROT|nr:type I-E CRISPR-associated protein Cas6/Cse3/CasE [Roseomonas oleicola]MBU8546675.1 type I-E CRISPR-associated protein Cas6/Cse3/CasE [Roseomonas oleicola]
MTALWLSRIRLRQAPSVAALAHLLVPEETGEQAAAAHRLIWALFSDGPDRQRDFLWRQDSPGQFLALSPRPPNPLHDIFEIESKDFAPTLTAGDRLRFRLHANPVVAQPQGPGQRGKRQDVVMHALYATPKGQRASVRLDLAQESGRAWLARQGTAHGFRPLGDVAVDGYETIRIGRGPKAPMRFGVLDFEGLLEVTDPAAFLPALAAGFGRARAFGCGLMLIRRAT